MEESFAEFKYWFLVLTALNNNKVKYRENFQNLSAAKFKFLSFFYFCIVLMILFQYVTESY